jgi:hypothetical protein
MATITVNQTYAKDLTFWRPNAKRPYNNPIWASATQIDGKALVSIPATSIAVQRSNGYAAYLRYPFYFQPSAYEGVTTNLQQGYPTNGVPATRTAVINAASHIVITSGGNPSPAPEGIAVGDYILVSDSFNTTGPQTNIAAQNPLSSGTPFVGPFGQAIPGRITYSNIQNLWLVGGNSGLGSAVGFSPKSSIDFVQVTNTNGTFTATSTNYSLGGNLWPTCCVLQSDPYLDNLFYTGGLTAFSSSSGVLATKMFSPTGGSHTTANAPENMSLAACINLPSCKAVLLNGGINSGFTSSQNLSYIFNPYNETWYITESFLITARRQHQMVLLNSYKGTTAPFVLVVGGKTGVISNGGQTGPDVRPLGTPLNQCEILNVTSTGVNNLPTSNPYVATGSMSHARYAFGMTQLPDGRVLVCGGIGYDPGYPPVSNTVNENAFELSSCEIFDPNTGSWTPIQSMHDPHSYCVCAYVANTNKVYVYGGYTSTAIEYLDLSTMQWHYSTYSLGAVTALGSPVAMNGGFLALVGGGIYSSSGLVTHTPSWWNSIVTNVPEYVKYDALNTEWVVTQYNTVTDAATLTSNAIGDYTNTSVRWSDAALGDRQTATFTLAKSVLSSATDIIGPFSFDLGQPFAVSRTQLTLNQQINAGMAYSSLKVVSGAFDLTPGWLLFNYGYANQCGPVKLLNVTDDQTLLIDSSFKFPYDLDVGDVFNVLYQRAAWSGPIQGSFWSTASNAGRVTCIALLQDISAAGIELDITTRYPNDRGLGAEGFPTLNNYKLSDIVECFEGDDLDDELAVDRGTTD